MGSPKPPPPASFRVTSSPGCTVVFCLGWGWRVPCGPVMEISVGRPGRPPINPNGGAFTLSYMQERTEGYGLRTCTLMTWPGPPWNLPAPPESGTNAFCATKRGEMLSITSTGVLETVEGHALAGIPSLVARAPIPPEAKNDAMKRRPAFVCPTNGMIVTEQL